MAGALRYYNYVSDNGTSYGIRRDRTNSNATAGTGEPLFPVLASGESIGGGRPAGTRLRYANAFNRALPAQKRRFAVGNRAAFAALGTAASPTIVAEGYPGDNDVAGATDTWIVTSLVGERRRGIPNTTTTGSGLTN